MNESVGILSLLPPLLAIGIALWKKQIIPALLAGGLLAEFLLLAENKYGFFYTYLNRTIAIASKPDNMQIIVFSLLMGSLIALIKISGGFNGLIQLIYKNRNTENKTVAYLITWILGTVMFLENWSNILVNGSTVGPLYKKLGIPKERLAYFIHSISINIVALIVINSWGAFYMSLLSAQGVAKPFELVVQSVPFNFHCITSLLVVLFTMLTNWQIGPMKTAFINQEQQPQQHEFTEEEKARPDFSNMLLPIGVLIITMLLTLYVTGNGNLIKGDGTVAVFYAVITALLVLIAKLVLSGRMPLKQTMDTFFAGMGKFMNVGVLVVLALTMGQLCKQMGTGIYIAELAEQNIPLWLIPALFFLISCLISFSTGTSYGTFSIMVPIALQLADATGIHTPLIFAACISGGVFGDNTSPISGTSIVTGMAADLDVVQHVRTQLPYALTAATLAFIAFIITGIITL